MIDWRGTDKGRIRTYTRIRLCTASLALAALCAASAFPGLPVPARLANPRPDPPKLPHPAAVACPCPLHRRSNAAYGAREDREGGVIGCTRLRLPVHASLALAASAPLACIPLFVACAPTSPLAIAAPSPCCCRRSSSIQSWAAGATARTAQSEGCRCGRRGCDRWRDRTDWRRRCPE